MANSWTFKCDYLILIDDFFNSWIGHSGVSLNGTVFPWFDTFWSQSWLVYFSAAGVVCSSRCGGKTMYSRKELSQHLLIDLGADDQKHGEPRI